MYKEIIDKINTAIEEDDLKNIDYESGLKYARHIITDMIEDLDDEAHAHVIAYHISEMSDAAVLSFICASVMTLVDRSEGKVRPTEVLVSAARCIDESGVI